MLQVAYIAAGAGDLYCGACAADLALIRALRPAGVAALMVPLYTPLRDSEGVVSAGIFLGGISTWLRQSSLGWLAMPLRPMLDSAPVLKATSRFSIHTDPHALGPLTVSVLRGIRGPHAREIQRVASYLRDDVRPDVVHLSNSLLSGLARPLKDTLQCRIVCSVQGEEHFIAGLPGRYQAMATSLLRDNMRHVDVIVRPTRSQEAEVGQLLSRDPASFVVVPPALEARPAPAPRNRGNLKVGYLSAIRPEKGLDLLISALGNVAPRLPAPVEFCIAGQVADAKWWKRQHARLRSLLPGVRPAFRGELTPAEKALFLADCDIFVMPTRLPECRGMAALEAMAAGCAVVAPRHGIFPEMLADSPALLFEPGDARSLSDTLFRLLRNPPEVAEAAARGVTASRRYDARAAALQFKAIYERCAAATPAGTGSSSGTASSETLRSEP